MKLLTKIKLILIATLFVLVNQVNASTNKIISFVDRTNEKVNLTWNKKGSLQAEESVFISSFHKVYQDIPLKALNIKNVYTFLQNTFNDERKDFAKNDSNTQWVIATKKDLIVGYASFDIDLAEKIVYIRQLAVLPSQWRRKIGTNLVFSIKDRYPEIKRISFVTRKINQGGIEFFKTLNFKKSAFMHEDYNPELYEGYDLHLK